MRGRKPKPTLLKDLHGSEEPRNSAEPIPEGDLAESSSSDCPEHFNEEQRATWEYALRHSPPGLLKRIDRSALAAWVVSHCLHNLATLEQNKRGLLFRQGPQLVPSPFISIINRQAVIMLKAASELGFTPVSRPRIYAGGPATESLSSRAANDRQDAPRRSLQEYLDSSPTIN